jgi:hypothetical protein
VGVACDRRGREIRQKNGTFKSIEDLRRLREQQDLTACTSFNRDVSLARLS